MLTYRYFAVAGQVVVVGGGAVVVTSVTVPEFHPPPLCRVQITRAHTNGEGQNNTRPHTWSSTRALVWFYTYASTMFCWSMPAGAVCELG